MSLKSHWIGYHYHASYFFFSRGVSILVHKTMPFKLLHLDLDPGGWYVGIHVILDALEVVLLGFHLPPLTSLKFLCKVTTIFATYALDNIIVMGDFNLFPNHGLERMTSDGAMTSGLSM